MTNTPRYPNSQTIVRSQLGNGLTLLVYENFASQTAVIDGLLHAGALYEPLGKDGLASMTTALLMRGTQQRSYDDIYEVLESIGAHMGFSSAYHAVGFSAQCLAEDFEQVLTLLAQSLRTPTFPEVQVAQVRGQMLTGLQIQADDTGQQAHDAFRQLAYAGHPYGRLQQGTVASLTALSGDDTAAFHRHHFGPRHMVLTVVGAVKAEAALQKVTEIFGDWHNAQQPEILSVPDQPLPNGWQETAVVMPDKMQSDIVLGLPGPRRSAPDYLHASLMNTVLGVFGMMGRIGQNVREVQGLAYYAYSRLQGGLGPSPWTAVAGVAPEDTHRAIRAIVDEIARIQNELVAADELADSQAYRIGSLPVSLETNGALANVITDMEMYQLGLDFLIQYPDLIRAITPQQVQAAAQAYLRTEDLVVAVAGRPAPELV